MKNYKKVLTTKLPLKLPKEVLPDNTKECIVCGNKPIIPVTGMCGVCTFGEAECVNGNWD